MNYTEIEKLVSFSNTCKQRNIWGIFKGLPKRDLFDEIQKFDVNPAVKEMQNNFQLTEPNTQVEERLERDYNIYLNALEENILQYDEFEQKIFNWKVNRLKRQLIIKTLSSNLIIKETVLNETGLMKNLFPQIFSNDLGYTLFLKMHNLYKEKENKNNSNYSFLYYALDNDNLVTCMGSQFIHFTTTEFDVKDFTRIDSRYKEDYNKSKLYNAIKDGLPK